MSRLICWPHKNPLIRSLTEAPLAQTHCKETEQDLVLGTSAVGISFSLSDSLEEGPSLKMAYLT